MSGLCCFCLCVTAVCASIVTEHSPTIGRNVSKKLTHINLHHTDGEKPLHSAQGEISWYSCGERHCRCHGYRADCSNKHICYIPQLPPGITFVDFSHNNISSISEDILVNVTGLTGLDLSHNDVQSVSPDAFRYMTNLTHLNISYNDLTTEAVYVVFNISTLEKLRIERSVQCATVEDIRLKQPMPRLQELNFGVNDFVTLNMSWFLFFPGLTRLEIACDAERYHRHTKMFNHQSLHNLSNLTYLDMSYCTQSCDALSALLTIPSLEVLLVKAASACSVFCDIDIPTTVPRLQELHLGNNSAFEELNLTCLSPFTGLRRLHLNDIDEFSKEEHILEHRAVIDYHALHFLPNLTYLDLSDNGASCDDLPSILTIPSLQELIMRRSIACSKYDGKISRSLIKVDLSYNKLILVNFSLPHEVGGFSPLQVLSLRGNWLGAFTLQTCHKNSSISVFPFLDTLDLFDNYLTDFNDKWEAPVCLPGIKSIDLRRNVLYFWYSSFANDRLGRLETLYVSKQKKDVTTRNIKKDVFRNPHLKTLRLSNNEIEFNDWLQSVDADCFSGCPNLIYLSVGYNDFKGVSEERFHQLFGSLVHLRELSLRSIEISFVTVGMFQGLKSLKKLDMSKNNLVSLPDGVFRRLPNLQRVDISVNKISVVHESTFSFTTRLRLRHIDLSENPFDCSCQVLWFQKWFLANPSLFADSRSEYTCGNLPGITVHLFFKQEQACLLSPETSKFIIATISLIFTVMSLLSFLYRYRWHIRLVLHEALRGPEDRLRRLRERRFEYDVYEAYDSEDFPWVRDHLLPNLEGRMGLKLCIQQRDFILGCPVVDNIMGCLNSSKKMLMLFSRAFVESEWCQFELQMCLIHAMNTEDALMLVLLEDIPPRHLTPAMVAVMQTTTYIEWAGNDNALIDSFWRRIRLALREILQNV